MQRLSDLWCAEFSIWTTLLKLGTRSNILKCIMKNPLHFVVGFFYCAADLSICKCQILIPLFNFSFSCFKFNRRNSVLVSSSD